MAANTTAGSGESHAPYCSIQLFDGSTMDSPSAFKPENAPPLGYSGQQAARLSRRPGHGGLPHRFLLVRAVRSSIGLRDL